MGWRNDLVGVMAQMGKGRGRWWPWCGGYGLGGVSYTRYRVSFYVGNPALE